MKLKETLGYWMKRIQTAFQSRKERKEDQQNKKKAKKTKSRKGKIAQLVAVGFLSILLILTGCVGIAAENLLGQIDRSEITGDENANFEDEVGTVSGDDWVDDILATMSQPEPDPVSKEEKPTSSQVTSSATSSTLSPAELAQIEINNRVNKTKAGYAAVQNTPLLSNGNGISHFLLIGADKNGLGDSTILVSINRNTGKIHLTSLMRAMYVSIPGRDWHMFNHAYAWGGPRLAMQTIENNFRIKVENYIVVNFNSFPRIIDAVGGVSLNLTKAEAEYLTGLGYSCSPGLNALNGQGALMYCRIRMIDSDFQRTNRQRNVIEAMIRSAMQLSPTDLYGLAGQLASMVNTNMSNSQILQLASEAPAFLGYKIDQKMLPVENDTSNGQVAHFAGKIMLPYAPGSTSRVEMYTVDFEKNVAALHKYIKG